MKAFGAYGNNLRDIKAISTAEETCMFVKAGITVSVSSLGLNYKRKSNLLKQQTMINVYNH